MCLPRIYDPRRSGISAKMRSRFSRRANKQRPIAHAIVFAALSMLASATAFGAPYRPIKDATVLVTVPKSAASVQSELRRSQNQLAAHPDDLPAALELARLAIRDGRANADPRRYGQAQAALGSWWSDPNAPMEVRVLRAIIRQSLHDFTGAEADLNAILTADPKNGQARLIRAFIRQTIGELAAAKEDCRSLPPSVGLTAAAVCLLRAEALTGSSEKALQRLNQVLMIDGRAEPQVRRWAQAVAAEMAMMLGQSEAADRSFAEATGDGSGDIPTLVAMADHFLDTGRPQEVLTLLADRSEADIVYLRLAIAGKALNDPRTAHWMTLLDERFAAASASGVQLHLREEARFELEVKDNASAALQLSLANWRVQKEPGDARLVLQAALAAHQPVAAHEVLDFIENMGLVDMRIEPLKDKIKTERS